jgi:hypothetical protein
LCIVSGLRRRIGQRRDELRGDLCEAALIDTCAVNRRCEGDYRGRYRCRMEYVTHKAHLSVR